jgi:hypothetical protein
VLDSFLLNIKQALSEVRIFNTEERGDFFRFFLIFILLICAGNVWVISLPFPYSLSYPLHPLPLPPTPSLPGRNILPLSLILLKREYKQ